ncbi:ice-binding family protein [Nocardioides sp. W7]|uniref:ice-binding family protein n=1 Tax=Nocardioides sp. W7 TaxID=2931390 RepID=UPI001FD4717F|nr:ice-binding family protein [Nocardioides sp. W7]
MALTAALVLAMNGPASAAQPQVGLGTAAPFAVLAGSTVTNTGPSVISGDVGVSAGSQVVGFPPGIVNDGTIHAADAVAALAQDDLTTAYDDAAGRGPVVDQTSQDLGGQTLIPGVYDAASAMALTGTVTLDAQGDPDAVFVFKAGSTLITASGSRVALVGGAQACHVFWQVGSSATLGTSSDFVGTVLALTSISAQTRAVVLGRLLARNGAVTLDTNTITRPGCAAPTVVSTATPSGGPSATPGATPSTTPSTGDGTPGDGTPGDGTPGDGTPGDGTPGDGTPGDGTPGGDTPGGDTPWVPVGHPGTGSHPTPVSGDGWLMLGLLCLGGAGATAIVGSRSTRRRRV